MRIYGPVPSRRFGLSLGIDIVPHKTCTFDCIYCQLGPTDQLVCEREDFYDVDGVMADVAEALDDGPMPDVITLAGSGDPSVYSSLGDLIDRLKATYKIPILLITNSALLWQKEAAAAAMKADILAPSLDAGDPETYKEVNLPHPSITFEMVVEGLRQVTHAFPGEVRLEIMLVKDVNDSEESLRAIAEIVKTLKFDSIDVNTPVRPPVPERGAVPCDEDTLKRALELFGPKASAIGTFEPKKILSERAQRSFSDQDKDIKETLARRPCTVEDIVASLHLHRQEVIKSLERLKSAGFIEERPGATQTYYAAVPPKGTLKR